VAPWIITAAPYARAERPAPSALQRSVMGPSLHSHPLLRGNASLDSNHATVAERKRR